MKWKIYLLCLVLAGTLMGCGSSSKTVSPTADSQMLDQWVAEQDFEINSEWAIPLLTNAMSQVANAGLYPPGSTANRISLIGNSNFLKVKGREVEANLPYYGERQAGGGYGNTNTGIQFNGTAQDFEVIKDENTLRHKIKFRVMDKTEAYDIGITLYPNLKSEVVVNSSQRLAIRYQGTVKSDSEELP